jgi:DNA-directed RNA polymerase subunit RPC12/RpoP
MELDEKGLVCKTCKKRFKSAPRISLFGFQKFRCPACGNRIVYPLFKRSYYWMILCFLGIVIVFAMAGLLQGDWSQELLSFAILSALYVLERVSYILFPLAAWAILRLVGMFYPSALQAARTILWYTGKVALIGILIGLLGGIASLVWRGIIIEPLVAALLLSLFFIVLLGRDKLIRHSLRKA